jgi:2-oxoglutarate ferredoxin oxidoreductase subunit alpha
MDRLKRKFETARQAVPAPVVDAVENAKIGIIAYGTTMFAIDEARDRLAADGVPTSYMRLRALPVNKSVKEFVAQHDRVYVIELNRDGQMHNILQTEMPEIATKLVSLAYLDGMPLTARWVVEAILEREGN